MQYPEQCNILSKGSLCSQGNDTVTLEPEHTYDQDFFFAFWYYWQLTQISLKRPKTLDQETIENKSSLVICYFPPLTGTQVLHYLKYSQCTMVHYYVLIRRYYKSTCIISNLSDFSYRSYDTFILLAQLLQYTECLSILLHVSERLERTALKKVSHNLMQKLTHRTGNTRNYYISCKNQLLLLLSSNFNN